MGACVLHWTREAREIWPNSEICLFEAMESLEFLYKENNLPSHMGVLSDVDGKEVGFYQNDFHPGGNSYYIENPDILDAIGYPIKYTEDNKKIVNTTTLDTAAKSKNFPMPDLLKIDVQGAEYDVLRGAVETLKSVKHVILELQKVDYNRGAPLCDFVIDYMNQQGFDCLGIFSNNGPDGDYHFRKRDV